MKKFLLIAIFMILPIKANALGVKHYFSAWIGIFNGSTAEFEYNLSNTNYSVSSTVRTNGTFNALYPFEAKYATTGKVFGDNLQTSTYKYSSQSRYNKRTKETIYNEAGLPLYSISTRNKKEKRKNIDAQNQKDTTDLQTVFAKMIKSYNELNFCDATHQIFDGKRRFDVIFKDEGNEEIKKNEHSPFFGASAKCSMYIDKLEEQGDDFLWELTSDKPVYFWIMKDKKTKAHFIAKILVDNPPLGTMTIYTTKIETK